MGFWRPSDPVDLTLPPKRTRRQRPGLRMHFRRLDEGDVQVLGGLLVTSVARTLADCGARLGRIPYLSVVDSALFQGLFPAEGVPALAEQLRRTRCPAPADWLGLVDARAESPSETKVRIVLTDAGLPPDELQLVVRDENAVPIARLDIAYRRGGRRVGMEVDSGEHDRVRALYRDRIKHNA